MWPKESVACTVTTKASYSTGSMTFGKLCLICAVLQISRSNAHRDDFLLERVETLSSPIMSVLLKTKPRSVEILLHATSDHIDYDRVCANILKQFPTKVFKFEDQKPSEIPPRKRLYEELVVVYLYTGYHCYSEAESRAVVKRMRGLYWWFLRTKLLFVASTIIDCTMIKPSFEEFWNNKLFLNFAITSTKDLVTYHKYDPFEKTYESTNLRNYSDIFKIYRKLDMFGNEIRSTTVNDPPLIIVNRDNDTGTVLEIKGIGHEILEAVCELVNATYVITPRPDDELGLWLKNGTITGVFNDVMTGKADINPHGQHMFNYGKRLDSMEFVDAAYYDELWAMVPKNQDQSVSQLKYLLPILCIVGALIAVKWLVAFLLRFDNFMRDPLMIFRVLVGTSFPHTPVQSSQRILLYSWIASAMILSSHFQSSLVHSMSFEHVPRDMETLQELEASGRSVMMFSGVIDIAYASVDDTESYMNRLRTRTFPGEYRKYCAHKLLGPWSTNVSCTPGTFQANSYIHTMLRDGEQTLTTIKERFFGSWQTFLVRRGTPWIPHMHKVILHLRESGLIYKWLSDCLIREAEPTSAITFRPLTMETFDFVLVILMWCYFLSIFTFGIEHIYFRYRKNIILWFRSVRKRQNCTVILGMKKN